jgi:hypothetical protein
MNPEWETHFKVFFLSASKVMKINVTGKLAQAEVLMTVWGVPALNLGWGTSCLDWDYCGFPQSLKASASN